MDFPKVECLMTCYGRPKLSIEAVECFLKQTYQNKKLIIINTHHSPVFFNRIYQDIEIHNVEPFKYLSDVYRFGLDLISAPYFFFFDDDDLYMPWHIEDRVTYSIEHPEFDAVGHTHCMYSINGNIKELARNMFVAQYLYKNNGIRPDSHISCWDVNWHNKPWKKENFTFPFRPSYVYRWGTGESHISGKSDENGQHQNYLDNIESKKKINFNDPWVPLWNQNYEQQVLDLLKKEGKI